MRQVRNRTKRTPTGRAIYTTARDLDILDLIQRHERVSSHEVYTYQSLLHQTSLTDRQYIQRRLRNLYHEKGFVERPRKQRETDTFHSNYLIYSLTEAGELELGTRRHVYAKRISGWEQHLHFLTRLTVWMELACIKHGLQYIHREKLFERADTKQLRIMVGDTPHIPDDIFGINYGDRRRYFALEADRATEDLKTIFRKIDVYDALMHSQQFKQWGIFNITVLICTLSPGRALTVLDYIRNNTRYPKAFLIKAYPQFDRPYAKATDFWEVLEKPWTSAQGEYSIMTP